MIANTLFVGRKYLQLISKLMLLVNCKIKFKKYICHCVRVSSINTQEQT